MNKKCSNCGHNNVENAKFCLKCGNTLENYNAGNLEDNNVGSFEDNNNGSLENTETENLCPKCGSGNYASSNFCEICGSPLATGETNNNAGQTNYNVANNDTNQENLGLPNSANSSSSTNLDDIACPHCGTSIPAKAQKCRHCGHWVKKRTYPVEYEDSQTYSLAIVLGYLLTIFLGIIGLIVAIYLVTRDNKEAKTHGKIQLVLFGIMFILGLFFLVIRYS